MTLTELKYIVALAQEKNFNRAAEKCFVSQPTLSIAIKKLEQQLDVTLFERSKNHVSVTAVGQRIVQQAQQVLEATEKINLIANQGQNQLHEVLRVGAIHTVGPYLYPYLIKHINTLAPNLPLIVEENFTTTLTERLQTGALDLAIVALPYKAPGITTLPLYRETFEIIIPKHHAWQHKSEITPDDFKNQTVLLLGEGNCLRDQILTACPACALPAEAKTNAEKMLEGSSLETIGYMVSSGMGISVMPSMASQRQGNNVIIKHFAKPAPYRDIAIAYRNSFPRPDAIKLLQRAITECHIDNIQWLTPQES